MIWESWPWKRQLLSYARSLQRRVSQRHWSAASLAKLEQEVFVSAYSIRKLMEACKLSDEVESLSLQVVEYRPLKRPIDIMNCDKIDKLYDLENPSSKQRLGIADYCNQVIHSFVFVVCFNKDRTLNGFFISSDRKKHKTLYHVDARELTELLIAVGNDDVLYCHQARDGNGEMQVVIKSSRLPVPQNDRSLP